MAIRGRLDELQASEVLQFLTQSGRTGTLRLERGRWTKFLAFENGRLVFAVSQHELPPLAEILYQRGSIDSIDETRELRFDDEVTKALEWRRSGNSSFTSGAFPRTRLGRILVEQGRIEQSDLASAVDPARMPEAVLEEVLIHSGALTRAALTDLRRSAAPNESLHATIIKTRALTHEQIAESIACMPEKSLARLLVFFGHVTGNEGSYCAEQLDALRGRCRPSFRIGEYLVACGKLTQRQLERALAVQLTRRCLLGTILIEQEALTKDDIAEAERHVAELRMSFSPLRVLRDRMIHEFGFSPDGFVQARIMRLQSHQSLAQTLIDTGRIAEADLRTVIEEILTLELSDLMLWREGSYEFFNGFTLADALGDDALARIHDFTFEVSSLLLDAHYRLDALRRRSIHEIGPQSILCAAGVSDPEIPPAERRLIERMDGRRPLDEVCAVLPGNLLAHREHVARMVQSGWVEVLSAAAAFDKAMVCVDVGDYDQAITYFEHAGFTGGDGPGLAEVQMWTQRIHLLRSSSYVRRLGHTVAHRAMRMAARKPVQDVLAWCGRHKVVTAPAGLLVRGVQGIRARWRRFSRRLILTTQDFMIQKGLARHWWTVRNRWFKPAPSRGGRRGAKLLTTAGILLAVSLALLIPGITAVGPRAKQPEPDARKALRMPIRKLAFEVPIEVRPALTERAIYLSSRDGLLRGLPLKSGTGEPWEVKLGEYGDLLSSPTCYRDRLYVANVRGSVHAVSTGGEQLWVKRFRRVEAIAPTIIVDNDKQVVGVAIAARESLVVLRPEDGEEFYRIRCGNVIEARPVVAGSRVFVGSSDNHVYCANWQTRLVLWDTEVGQDVMSLTMVDGALLVRQRGGGLIALRAVDGSTLWQSADEMNRVRSAESVGGGVVALEMYDGAVHLRDANSGEMLKRLAPTKVEKSVRMITTGASRFFYSERGAIGQVDETGRIIWRCQDGLRRISSLVTHGDHLVVTSESGEAWVFSLRDDESRGATSDE